jgi:phage-related protein
MVWEVLFFESRRGEYPVKEFIVKQDKKTYAKILHFVVLLKNNGPYLKLPYSKKLAPDLYELRIQGRNSIRILYTFRNKVYYLLHAFKKKSQKIPKKELKTALDRINDLI